MPVVRGKCTNFGLCPKADGREWIEAALEDFVCPECGRPLEKAGKPAGGGSSKTLVIAGAAGVILAAAGVIFWQMTCCAPPPVPDPEPNKPVVDKGSDQKPWLRLAGSDTMASRLAPALVTAFNAKEPEKRTINITGEGSTTAFECLQQGTCEIGMSSRQATPTEAANLTEKVVALDAVALIVNASRPKTTVSEAVSSSHFFNRNEKSGTGIWFLAQVAPKIPDGAVTVANNAEMLAKVQADRQGLGYVSRAFVAAAVQELAPEGKPFTRDSIATESHPWARRLYFYLPANPTPAAQQFTDFATSEAGQKVAENAGFVGQNIRMVSTVKAPENAPPEYQGVAAIAERLSLDIRFETNSRVLDSKAKDDLDRIVKLLNQPALKDRKILLFGFADAQGSRGTNLTLSKDRAQAVATALKGKSIDPALITGFGQDLPVAPNDTEANREKNRRVEIWLRR
jgi:phosphate transport system substrate-binding protein